MPNGNIMNHYAYAPVDLDIGRSAFDESHGVKFDGNVGDLIIADWQDVVPGDTWTMSTAKIIRMQPMVCPVFDNLFCDTYHFFVPYRLLWDHFKQFMGETENTPWIQPIEYTVPQIIIPSGGFDFNTIADYIGVPPKMAAGKSVNAFPFRAYAKIVSDWFYDQNLQTPPVVPTDDTNVTGVNTGDQVTDLCKGGKPFNVNKYHDYFSSSLPSPQRAAATQVQFGLNGLLPVNSYNRDQFAVGDTVQSGMAAMKLFNVDSSSQIVAPNARNLGVASSGYLHTTGSQNVSMNSDNILPANLYADLNNTSLFDINELRQAFAIQRYFERQARVGSRYIELVRGFFGVTSPDARQQRSEFLGGNRLPLTINEVTQTSATQTGLTPQGNVSGLSATGDSHDDFQKSFTEHGIIMTLVCVRYNHSYAQGIDRALRRKTLFQWYNPVFANLGESAVMSTEIYADANDDTVFGYQEAWADYRTRQNRICGSLRPNHPTSLAMWHFSDYYTQEPTLSASWIREDKSNVDRALAVTSAVAPQFWCDFWFDSKAVRPMPAYSIPGLIDHH